MSAEQRLALINQIQKERESRVIAYLTGDRQPGLETRIGMDVFPCFYDVLSRIGKQKQIDLLVYSTGGATMAAWGLVNLVREFCDKLCVLVPYKAHSSATLIALGADEIVMSRMGQLSPVDPTVTSPFNPTLPAALGMPPQFLPLSVEDVVGFMDLMREEAKIKEEASITEVVKALASDVRPIALGSVYRAKKQIGMLAKNLLRIHMSEQEQPKIEKIVATLTRELYSHDYLVGRKEAKELIGLKVAECSEDFEKTMMDLYSNYAETLELNEPYNQDVVLGNQTTRVVELDRAFIETMERTYVFRTKREVKRFKSMQQGVPVEGFQERTLQEGWRTENRKA